MLRRALRTLIILFACVGSTFAQTPVIVQNVKFGGGNEITTLRNLPLPNVVLSGNIVIVTIQCANNETPTVSDDKSGVYTVARNQNDATNGQRALIAYRQDVTDGPSIVKVTGTHLTYLSGGVLEVSNVYDATNVIDSVNGTTIASATTGQPGSITTSVTSFVVSYIAQDSVDPYAAAVAWASSTSPTNWTTLTSDTMIGEATAYFTQSGAGAINPTWTIGTARRFLCLQVAFKIASRGQSATTLPRLISVFHQGVDYNGGGVSPMTVQIPFTGQGNLFYIAHIGSLNPTTITDSVGNTWTATSAAVRNTTAGNSGYIRAYYCVSPTLAAGMTFTLNTTGSGSASGDQYFFYEAIGTGTPSLDVNGSNNNVTATGTSYQLGSITILTANGLVFSESGQNSKTALSVNTGRFLSSTDPNEETSPWQNDNNNYWGAYQNGVTTGAFAPTVTTDGAAGPVAWVSDAFKWVSASTPNTGGILRHGVPES